MQGQVVHGTPLKNSALGWLINTISRGSHIVGCLHLYHPLFISELGECLTNGLRSIWLKIKVTRAATSSLLRTPGPAVGHKQRRILGAQQIWACMPGAPLVFLSYSTSKLIFSCYKNVVPLYNKAFIRVKWFNTEAGIQYIAGTG